MSCVDPNLRALRSPVLSTRLAQVAAIVSMVNAPTTCAQRLNYSVLRASWEVFALGMAHATTQTRQAAHCRPALSFTRNALPFACVTKDSVARTAP
jgi:hypothetical protein